MKTDTANRQQVGRVSALPRVNLLPPEIEERKKLRQIQFGLGIIVVAAIGGVVYFYQHAAGGVTEAQDRIDTAAQQQTALQSKLVSLRDVQQMASKVEAREAMLSRATATEIHWSTVLNDLSVNIPNNVWLTKLQIQESATPGSALDRASVPATIGTMTFSGTAMKHNDVATWLEKVVGPADGSRYVTNPFYTSSTEAFIGDKAVVNFDSTADVTSDALAPEQKVGE